MDEFYQRHQNGGGRSIEEIAGRWEQQTQLDDFLGTSVAGGVTLGDLMVGDGLRDQISPELLRAFHNLMSGKAASYDQVRERLLDCLQNGHASVLGMVNKIKGQVGENWFMDQAHAAGFHARLASSGSQEAWDVAIDHAHHATQYVQVKMYQNPAGIVDQIREVHEKLQVGHVMDGGHAVHAIEFAIPANIKAPVQERLHDLGIHTPLHAIPHTAREAGAVVQTGFDHVGPDALQHLFGQLFVAGLGAAALHGLVQGFLIYKGSKDASNFLHDTAESTSLTLAGVSAGMGVEAALAKISWIGGVPTFALVLTTSIATRAVLKRVLSRHGYVEWLEHQNQVLRCRLETGTLSLST